MDASDTELKSIETTNVENVQATDNTQETAYKDCKVPDDTDNICKDSAMEETEGNETALTKQKETIEILNVELVAPLSADYVEPDIRENQDIDKTGLSEISNGNLEDNGVPIQMDNDNLHEDEMQQADENFGLIQSEEKENSNEIQPIDENFGLIQSEEKEDSNRNTEETITSILDPLSQTVTNGLGLLAQYCSDDDNDSVVEVPTTSTQDYRSQVVEIDSDSSDDSSDSSDVEYLNELRKTIEKRIEVVDEDDDDDNEENGGKKRHQPKLRVKGELLLDDLPPIQELKITVPEDECEEFGKVHSIVDQLVLVSALPNAILLNLETVIFLEKGQKVLGEVFDVLGQVADPLYCVRFNSNKQIKEKQINIGDVVYVAPKTQYTQYVILSNLIKLRGSDASWENDVEPPPRFLDYSDDEQEQMAKRQMRNKDRPTDNDDPTKRSRTEGDGNDTNSSKSNNLTKQHRNRHNEQRNTRGGMAGYSNMHSRPRSSGPLQNQHSSPNHHRSSWHSNYYPQPFAPHPTVRYGMRPILNQSQSAQPYSPNVPPYPMHPAHIPYSSQQPTRYGPPIIHSQHSPQPMPGAFIAPPSTHHGTPPVSHHQYSSNPPPPPGSQ